MPEICLPAAEGNRSGGGSRLTVLCRLMTAKSRSLKTSAFMICYSFASRIFSLLLFCRSDPDRKGLGAARTTDGVLALFSGQAERCLTLGAITEHMRIRILVAVVATEHATDLIFHSAISGVFLSALINIFGKCSGKRPDAKSE